MSIGSGGQSSSRATVDTFQGHIDEDDEEDNDEAHDRGYDELDESQLKNAPSTQPTQVAGTRRRRPPCKYTPGTGALGYKGKAKTRKQ
jgi:FtsZ-interacting cell division protein YlmF